MFIWSDDTAYTGVWSTKRTFRLVIKMSLAMRKTRSYYVATFVYSCNVRLATDHVNASRHDENA